MVSVGKMFRLDLMTMKVYFKSYLIFLIYPVIFAAMNVLTIAIMAGFMFSFLSSSIFSVQEKNRMDRLYGVMGVSTGSLMGGRYLFLAVNGLIPAMVMVPLQAVIGSVLGNPSAADEILMAMGVSILAYWIITGLQTPLSVKFGYTKSRFWSMIPFLIICLAPMLLVNVFKDQIAPVVKSIDAWYEGIARQPLLNLAVMVLASLVIATLSYLVSVRCYESNKK